MFFLCHSRIVQLSCSSLQVKQELSIDPILFFFLIHRLLCLSMGDPRGMLKTTVVYRNTCTAPLKLYLRCIQPEYRGVVHVFHHGNRAKNLVPCSPFCIFRDRNKEKSGENIQQRTSLHFVKMKKKWMN